MNNLVKLHPMERVSLKPYATDLLLGHMFLTFEIDDVDETTQNFYACHPHWTNERVFLGMYSKSFTLRDMVRDKWDLLLNMLDENIYLTLS